MYAAIQFSNLLVRFLLELCGLVALGYWGYHAVSGCPNRALMSVMIPLVMAVLWALLGSPNALFPLSSGWHWLLESVVFGFPVIALFLTGLTGFAWTYGLLVVINRWLMFVWNQS
ncbi:MAG: YrdB family protein [Bacillaceae bacterium]|nr:YrdB family protein [Bacillaceae bacterium]